MKKRVFLVSLISVLILAVGPAMAELKHDFVWTDINQDFPGPIEICSEALRPDTVTVNLSEEFLGKKQTDGVLMNLTLESNTWNYDLWKDIPHPDFALFVPKIKVNDDKERRIPVKISPAEQTVKVEINSKYLNPGENKIVFLYEFTVSGITCQGGSEKNCKGCRYLIKNIKFE